MSSPDAFFDGFLDDYFAESDEHLTAAADALLRLDKSLGQPSAERAAVDDLFRYFHTLKAISAMVELRPAEELAHHLEHYLRAIREGDIALTTGGTDALIEGTRRLEHIIRAHRDRSALAGHRRCTRANRSADRRPWHASGCRNWNSGGRPRLDATLDLYVLADPRAPRIGNRRGPRAKAPERESARSSGRHRRYALMPRSAFNSPS